MVYEALYSTQKPKRTTSCAKRLSKKPEHEVCLLRDVVALDALHISVLQCSGCRRELLRGEDRRLREIKISEVCVIQNQMLDMQGSIFGDS
ncbi:hypothetical protein CEXT_457981 [Caerostris extrusa]|uniref:Uncharacterized protein n=1 Tax=Caerostris extrusa TaxID=172846 RepID=A0AAV4WW03_CAEEX|nr:hypothetical protein CEXT_457981 [Caerostris extrusa]